MKVQLTQGMIKSAALAQAGISGHDFAKGKSNQRHKNKKLAQRLGHSKHKARIFD